MASRASFLISSRQLNGVMSKHSLSPGHHVSTPFHRITPPTGYGISGFSIFWRSYAESKPLSEEQQRFLDRALRVNQAGELAAVLIYDAQTPQIVRSHPQLKDLMKHMYDQEASHFRTFNELVAKHRIRPTVMYPVWRIAASALGWSTAIMGREAAMACTEAVETEIGEHYNRQVQFLLEWAQEVEKSGGVVSQEIQQLISTIRRIRDEELEHLDQAVENDSKEARPYELLTGIIRGGCRAAIWISERV